MGQGIEETTFLVRIRLSRGVVILVASALVEATLELAGHRSVEVRLQSFSAIAVVRQGTQEAMPPAPIPLRCEMLNLAGALAKAPTGSPTDRIQIAAILS